MCSKSSKETTKYLDGFVTDSLQNSWLFFMSGDAGINEKILDNGVRGLFAPRDAFFILKGEWEFMARKIFCLMFACLMLTAVASAQDITGIINGRVTDASGAVIP